MKKLLLTALTVSMLALVGCSSDNDNNNDKPTPTNKIKLVSSMKYTENVANVNYSGDLDSESKATYDNQNRVTKGVSDYYENGNIYYTDTNTYDYTGNMIKGISILFSTIDNKIMRADTTYAEVNANGYIISTKSQGSVDRTFTYDSNVYMTSLVEHIPSQPIDETYNITWANGNIVKIQGDANAYDQAVYEYEYTNIENKMNIDLFRKFCDFEEFITGIPSFNSFYGKQCKNLVSKEKRNGYVVYEYEYTMTSDGYVSKVIQKGKSLGEIELFEESYSYIEVDAK